MENHFITHNFTITLLPKSSEKRIEGYEMFNSLHKVLVAIEFLEKGYPTKEFYHEAAEDPRIHARGWIAAHHIAILLTFHS